MNEKAASIKQALMVELSKQGHTLQDLESAMLKHAEDGGMGIGSGVNKAVTALPSFLNLAGGSAIGLGSLLGLAGYAAYRANDDSTQKKLKKMQEAEQYNNATKALQTNLARNIQ